MRESCAWEGVGRAEARWPRAGLAACGSELCGIRDLTLYSECKEQPRARCQQGWDRIGFAVSTVLISVRGWTGESWENWCGDPRWEAVTVA